MANTSEAVRVLVVDDEPIAAARARGAARKKGHDVTAWTRRSPRPSGSAGGLRRRAARHQDAAAVRPRAPQRREAPPARGRGHHDDRPRDRRDGARGGEGRGLRLPDEAVRGRRAGRAWVAKAAERKHLRPEPQLERAPRARGAAGATGWSGTPRAMREVLRDDRRGAPTARRPCSSRARAAPARSSSPAPCTRRAARTEQPFVARELRRAHRDPARERAVRPREGRASPARSATRRASSTPPTAAPSSSTRSATSRSPPRCAAARAAGGRDQARRRRPTR